MLNRLTLLLALSATLASAKTVTYNFDIGWVTVSTFVQLECTFTKCYRQHQMATQDELSVSMASGRKSTHGNFFPTLTRVSIPMIEADVGDTIVVNAKNSLGSQSTSLHFHGMAQQGSNGNDGPVSVTQCPILPGDSYTYTFIANPAGTHWYHSHDKGQYPDGLRGKMVIHDKAWEASLNIDKQMTYTMSDWYVS